MSTKTLLCDQWEFSKNPIGTEYSDMLNWERVDLPHDYLIYNTHNLYETSTGWYRRTLCHRPDGKRTALRFGGVYMDSRVFVNGSLAAEWKYGYTTFEVDITDLLREGENLIAVRVDYRSPNSRWYSGAGIYRRVWLKRYDPCHITNDGVYISAAADGTIQVTTEVERPAELPVSGLSVRNTIFDGSRKVISCESQEAISYGSRIMASTENPCCACDQSRISGAMRKSNCKYSVNTNILKLENPTLWDIDHPHLYTCVTEILQNGMVLDREECTFGFRQIEFTCDKGFFLNGRHVKLHGCCEHHDLGSLGAAVNKNAIRRKLATLRTMGINAIRTSHNPPAEEFMELADEMGFLVLSEGFDMWELHKTEHDYAGFFPEWAERDVAAWVRRDRNHPSVIAWSIGNEIYDTHASERGQEVTSLLLGLVREHDPRKNGYVTIGSNYMQGDNARRCADLLKLAGYNYAERLYHEHHAAHPDWMIYGSETSSVVQSRGIYHFPLSQQILCDDDEQCSALGNSTTGWAARNTEACIIPDRDAEFCAGQFIWTGFDYIGEPTPYSTKNSYFGQFDTAGFPKDSAYLFRGEWTDYKAAPFIHIYPYWDFCEGQTIDIRVASNAPRAALFFGQAQIAEKRIDPVQDKELTLVAEKELDHAHGTELTLNARLPYQPGELLAVAYDENGREIARDVRRSFGDAAEIRLTPDKEELRADGEDLIFVDLSAYDKDGEFVANANNRVFVRVTGAGRLIGLDNGDSTDFEQYKGTSRRLFSGKLLAIIAAKTKPGEILVEASSHGLPDSTLSLRAIPAPVLPGISADTENQEYASGCADACHDVPVRKIELAGESRLFTADRKEITFQTTVFPANASYAGEIDYRITTVLGIDSNLAEITSVRDGAVTVLCKGDGEFYLRALCKNGTDKYHILMQLPLKGEGIGQALLNPYEFVAGGLCTRTSEDIATSFGYGMTFARKPSWIGFEGIDFGKLGSDTILLPIYMNCSTPIRFSVYDGIPGQGGEKIGDYTYHKPSAWMTFNKPESFQLTKKLKGIHTLALASSDGISIKGFEFQKPVKEFSQIDAVDNEGIYGDKFTCGPDAITGIGNNVMLEFGEFCFTKKRPAKIIITGKSQLPANSIHILFSGDVDARLLVEFEGAAEYTEREFPLEGLDLSGVCCRVSFAFLPGSDFDFKAFRFE